MNDTTSVTANRSGLDAWQIAVEPQAIITPRDEVALIRQALANAPASTMLRERLAGLLLHLDQFDEAIAVSRALVEAGEGGITAALVLLEALVARGTVDDLVAAEDVAHRAAERAERPYGKASARALLGKVRVKLGDRHGARAVLNDALEIAPHHVDACKRLIALELDNGNEPAVLDLVARLGTKGVRHAAALVGEAMALARLGRMEAARAVVGIPARLHQASLPAPDGWDDVAGFNRAIAAELNGNPALRFDRHGLASVQSWRVDNPATRSAVAVHALQRQIIAAVRRHVAMLAASGDAWADLIPDKVTLHNWAVLSDAAGFEDWHIHQGGWMSGVYYVDVPERVVNGSDRAGCIAFGMPAERIGEAAAQAYGEVVVRPRSGLLLLFPSQAHHRTFPHGLDRRRICFAFDLVPD